MFSKTKALQENLQISNCFTKNNNNYNNNNKINNSKFFETFKVP